MITFVELRSPTELEKIVKQYFSQNDSWNGIVEVEKELYEFRSTMAEGENEIIAYEIIDGPQVLGLIQYRYFKGGFLKKEQLVINLLSLVTYSPDTVREIHEALIQKYNLSGWLVHTITKAEENMPIHRFLEKEGFEEHRNSYKHPKYGFEAGSLYFVRRA